MTYPTTQQPLHTPDTTGLLDVLVAGRTEDVRNRLAEVIRERGHRLHLSEHAVEAWSYYREHHPELVILAGVTSETLDLCRQIRSRPSGDGTVVVMVLYPYVREQLQAALNAGADECIMESLAQPERLYARIAFAEQQARTKRQRQQAEEELRASEAKAHAIIETTVEGIIVIDEEGIIESFNEAAETIFGYAAEEVVGEHVGLLMPGPWREEHDGYIQSYLATGDATVIGSGRDVRGLRKDGSTFPMQLGVNEVVLDGSRLFTGIVRDVSEQRHLEKEILRISEQERRRIGEDLHEGLGQILSGATILTEDLYQKLEMEGSAHADQALNISERLREADQYTDDLVRGLIPVDVDARGLVDALTRLTNNLADLFDINCELRVHGDPDINNPTVAFHLYRIAREAINNAVKHGRASRVTTTLSGGRNKMRIRVKDNGTGFSVDDMRDGNGIGLHIMQYRARIIGARLNIRANPSGGTVVTCTLSTQKAATKEAAT